MKLEYIKNAEMDERNGRIEGQEVMERRDGKGAREWIKIG